MNVTVPELLAALRRALLVEVLPAVGEEHARAQLAGVTDALAKLERMLVWSPDLLRERLAACSDAEAELLHHLAAAGIAAPAMPARDGVPPLPAGPEQAALEQAVLGAEQRQVAWTDWLYDQEAALPPALARTLHATLRAAMRRALLAERHRIARADFSAMTGTETST